MLDGEAVLAIEGVCAPFSGREVLHGVSFRLRPGEFCGLVGANGSGKTTLLRTVLGLQAPSEGRVRTARRGGARSIGYVPQKLALDPYLPVRAVDLVALGLDGNRPGLPLPSPRRARIVHEMLAAVGAAKFADQRLGTLSGGQQQRVLIAHARVQRPSLLLLDEPLANLDLRSAAEIVALLRRISSEHRIAVLLSAHDMNPLLAAMGRIVYIASGHAASGTVDEVVCTEVLSRLYGFPIDVIKVRGRVLVLAGDGGADPQAAVADDPRRLRQSS